MNRTLTKVLCALAMGTIFLAVTASRAQNTQLKPGLQGEYFDRLVELTEFPVLADTEKPDLTRVDAKIDWESADGPVLNTPFPDFLFVRWTGKIRIPRDGKYTLSLQSDDGSRAFINGQQIVDNGGTHAMDEKSGEVELKAGDHDLKIEYFENNGGGGCQFRWSGPGVEKQIVPESALFHVPAK